MYEIILHYYDLSQGMAKQMSQQLVGKYFEGIWHTGVCVYNKEFYYGGGISYDPPGRTPFGVPTKKVSLGFTELPEDMFMEFLREAQTEWSEAKYHVFEHNCNHFSNAAVEFLTGEGIPKDIVDQPKEFLATPLGQMVAPMMQQAQDSLKVQSNTVFNSSGQANPLQRANPAPGMQQQQPRMPPMGGPAAGGGMPGMGAGGGGLPAGLPPHLQQMMQNMNPQQMNQLMSRFGGMNMGGGAPAQQQQQTPQVGQLCNVTQLPHLQQIIKDYPGVIVDFWGQHCPPCLRIKPTFEAAAQANTNPNLVFVAVNTSHGQQCAQAFNVTGIPNFIAFLNGNQYKNFKGANEQMLFATIGELADKIPKGSVTAKSHDQMSFKLFKPTSMAPSLYNTMANVDKMKQFIEKFTESDTVKNEVGSVENFKKWMQTFSLEDIPNEAIDELMEMVQSAEEKSKIALIDLCRLIFQFERPAAHILHKHWETFDICIFQYLLCVDTKDPNNKIIHNYHLVSLKMLANIYQTQTGLDYVMDEDPSSQVIQFCEYSLQSKSPKSVATAGIVVFNHVLTYKRDMKTINQYLDSYFKAVMESIGSQDAESLVTLILSQIRILYKNQGMMEKVAEYKDKFVKVYQDLRAKHSDKSVKDSIDDLLSLVGEE